MDTRTGALAATRFTILLVAVSLVSCSRRHPEETYEYALAQYTHGYLKECVVAAFRGAEREHAGADVAQFWNFRLLEAEALAALSRNAEAKALLSEPVPTGAGLEQLEVRRLIDLAGLPGSDAAGLLQKARKLVPDPELLIRIHSAEGTLALGAEDAKSANESFYAAHQLAIRQSNPYWQFLALKNLCYSSRRQGHREESIEFGLQALAGAEKLGYRRIAAQARGNLVPDYKYLGDFESALLQGKQAVEYFKSIGAQEDIMNGLSELGLVYDETEAQKAVEYHKQAFEIAQELYPGGAVAARLAENLATALIRTDQWDAAAEWNQRATDMDKREAEIPYLQRNQAWIEYRGRGNAPKAIEICKEILRSDSTDPVIRWAVYDFLGEIYAKQKRFPEANQQFENALKVIEESRSELVAASSRITLLSRLMPFFRERVDFLVSQNDDNGALRAVESNRARVLAERPGRVVKPQKFPDTAGLQKFAKSTNSSILSFWCAPKRSFAWLITADNTYRYVLPGSAEIEKLVNEYRNIVEHTIRDPLTSKEAAGTVLWNELIGDYAQKIPPNGRVIVIPDGPLHRLNLETLVVPSSPKPHYWIEDVELAVAPSITVAMAEPALPPLEGKSLLLIGAPDYRGTSYEPLQGADREIQDIKARFLNAKPELHTGPEATPGAYRNAHPEKFKLIHLAAHAEANEQRPLESAVVLSHQGEQYKLYASDVVKISIRADVVTLSACHSAGARTYDGEGLMGFAWAFLQAGAHAVVAGLWAASDESTEPLMDKFYAGIAAGENPVRALRDAKRALLSGDARYGKPFFWAPFQIYLGFASR